MKTYRANNRNGACDVTQIGPTHSSGISIVVISNKFKHSVPEK